MIVEYKTGFLNVMLARIGAFGFFIVFAITCCLAADSSDRDGDGIPDSWEDAGFVDITWPNGNAERLDLTKDGPVSSGHKDIFVLVAWMADDTHTHKPSDAALQMVKDAFARAPIDNVDGSQGIRLHIYLYPTAFPEKSQIGHTDASGDYDWTEFNQLKASIFPAKLLNVFHFCLFAHDIDPAHYSGIAKSIPGYDFIVSLGGFGINGVGDTFTQAGSFMHELGHNLGLHHGGGDDRNYKPNYISVMNYSFQLTGLVVNRVPGALDYSNFVVDLDKAQLNEEIGMNVPPELARYGTRHFCPDGTNTTDDSIGASIYWDCDRQQLVSSAPVNVDVNGDGDPTKLNGFNDWKAITLSAPSPTAGIGLVTKPKPSEELSLLKANALVLPPVAQIEAERVTGGVKLSWAKIPLERVLAYRVYRSSSDQTSPTLVGTTEKNDFVDVNASKENKYSYTVTAAYVDYGRPKPPSAIEGNFGLTIQNEDAIADIGHSARASVDKLRTLGAKRLENLETMPWHSLKETARSKRVKVE